MTAGAPWLIGGSVITNGSNGQWHAAFWIYGGGTIANHTNFYDVHPGSGYIASSVYSIGFNIGSRQVPAGLTVLHADGVDYWHAMVFNNDSNDGFTDLHQLHPAAAQEAVQALSNAQAVSQTVPFPTVSWEKSLPVAFNSNPYSTTIAPFGGTAMRAVWSPCSDPPWADDFHQLSFDLSKGHHYHDGTQFEPCVGSLYFGGASSINDPRLGSDPKWIAGRGQ
jgi:hypothetical protein